MTQDEINIALCDYLRKHDLSGAKILISQEYSNIAQMGEVFLYECLEVLLILSIKDHDTRLFMKVFKEITGLSVNMIAEYRINSEYWKSEFLFSIGKIKAARKTLEKIFVSSNIESISPNTAKGILNLTERLDVTIPINLLELFCDNDDIWNRTKREFNRAVKAYEIKDFATARKIFDQLATDIQVKGRLTQGYCYIYMARIEIDKKTKIEFYNKAIEVFLLKDNKIMYNIVKKEVQLLYE